ncbi:MAG: pyruvate kinase [Candidatus Amoebophilus sp. 36-38]|nr:MAG: pyruvate kinase [Candidatus Amoebophilus sp. 36-38]
MITNLSFSEDFNKTKIIATVGPSTRSKEMLKKLIEAGTRIMRLNFSHGHYESHREVIDHVRALNKEMGIHVCLLQDLQGPKIRIGKLKDDLVYLANGEMVVLTPELILGNEKRITTTYQPLAYEVRIGDPILLDDGKITLKAIHKEGNELVTEVVHGGYVRSNKGLNLPATTLATPSLTEKDKNDLAFGLQHDIEWIALSFVRNAKDIIELKELIKKAGKTAKVIAKIEKPEALEHIEDIIVAADALMVARGDLGVEIAMEKVPMAQKNIVSQCNRFGKPVIIATQMMESMIENPVPTRAETNDIANAVIDGADALMLSAETALGKYPIQVVTEMKKTILVVEQTANIYNRYQTILPNSPTFYNDSLVKTACRLSHEIQAKAIVCLTQTGWTALELAKHRPQANILVFTDNKALLASINLIWNVRGYYYDSMVSTDQTFADIEHFLIENNYLHSGDVLISMASMPIHSKQRTNMLKVNIIP